MASDKQKLAKLGFKMMVVTGKDDELANELRQEGLIIRTSTGYTIDIWELTLAGLAALEAEGGK